MDELVKTLAAHFESGAIDVTVLGPQKADPAELIIVTAGISAVISLKRIADALEESLSIQRHR